MRTDIQFVRIAGDENAARLIKEKLDQVGKKYEMVIRADVFFKEEPDTYRTGKICEIRLSLPGPRLFAIANEASFEAAAAECVSEIEKQLEKRKNEMRSPR